MKAIYHPGRPPWTRRIAADLFPGKTTSFAWTLLRGPAEAALRAAYTGLGATRPPASTPLWQNPSGGHVLLDAAALAAADRELFGTAWLVEPSPERPAGMLARWQSRGFTQRAEARIAAATEGSADQRAEMARWLTWLRGQQWSQADLLQVMEELEPRLTAALTTYLILRAALPARIPALGGAARPGRTAPQVLPSVEAAHRILDVAALPPDDPTRMAVLDRYGHRGPGEARPDARRWADASELLAQLAAVDGLTGVTGQPAAVEPVLVAAADTAWDAFIVAVAGAQLWSQAAAREAIAAGLIADPEDVVFLELEELKQVATGEWHSGRAAQTAASVMARKAVEMFGQSGRTAPGVYPRTGEPWPPDPGAAPFWLTLPGAVAAGDDPWSPGALVARSLGLAVV